MILLFALVFCPVSDTGFYGEAFAPSSKLRELPEESAPAVKERIQPAGYPIELVERASAQLSDFSADIAHELRTPVNNIRRAAEVVRRRK